MKSDLLKGIIINGMSFEIDPSPPPIGHVEYNGGTRVPIFRCKNCGVAITWIENGYYEVIPDEASLTVSISTDIHQCEKGE